MSEATLIRNWDQKRSRAALAEAVVSPHVALHDDLTGLPNRRHYDERLDRELHDRQDHDRMLAVIGIDLDRFKQVNDTFGHAAGDDVLKIIAARLDNICRVGEFVARVGGDEFAAMKRFTEEDEIDDFLVRITEAIRSPLVISGAAGWTSSIGCSLGAALYPRDGKDRQTLKVHADLAMYVAKAAKENQALFYQPYMSEIASGQKKLGEALHLAICSGSLRLLYDRQSALSDDIGPCYKVSPLWIHPECGERLLSVDIETAERNGAILPIGDWVIRRACAEALTLPSDSRIAIRLSPVQLIHADLVTLVLEALLDSGLAAPRLELDVAQSIIALDVKNTLQTLRALKQLGVRIAIADYDGGYRGLDLVKLFPFDSIKLDNDARQDVPARDVTASILALAKYLNMPVLIDPFVRDASSR